MAHLNDITLLQRHYLYLYATAYIYERFKRRQSFRSKTAAFSMLPIIFLHAEIGLHVVSKEFCRKFFESKDASFIFWVYLRVVIV